MGFWQDVKEKITNSIQEVQTNPILDAFATSALEGIPVVGSLLLKIYDNSRESPEDKTQQVLQLLKKMESMKDDQLEEFCRNIKTNEELILKNQKFLKNISRDTSNILDKIEESRQDMKSIKDDLGGMGNEIHKIYEIVQTLQIQKHSPEPTIHDPNSFLGHGFKISWPASWEKVSDEELRQFQIMVYESMGMSYLPKEEQYEYYVMLRRKSPLPPYYPNINITGRYTGEYSLGMLFEGNKNVMTNLGFKIVNAHLDEINGLGSLEIVANPVDAKIYQIQKYYLRNKHLYIMTISDLSQEKIKEEPSIPREITQITQSLRFVD